MLFTCVQTQEISIDQGRTNQRSICFDQSKSMLGIYA